MARAAVSNVSQRSLGDRGVGRIDEHGNTSGPGHQLAQEFQPLCRQLDREKIDPRQVAARPGEAGNKTKLDRVVADDEDDGDRRGCRLGRERRRGASGRGDHRNPSANQFGRQLRQSIVLTLSPAVFDRHVLALDIAASFRPWRNRAQTVNERVRRCGWSNPITGIAACCARAASGHAPPRRRAA